MLLFLEEWSYIWRQWWFWDIDPPFDENNIEVLPTDSTYDDAELDDDLHTVDDDFVDNDETIDYNEDIDDNSWNPKCKNVHDDFKPVFPKVCTCAQ